LAGDVGRCSKEQRGLALITMTEYRDGPTIVAPQVAIACVMQGRAERDLGRFEPTGTGGKVGSTYIALFMVKMFLKLIMRLSAGCLGVSVTDQPLLSNYPTRSSG